MKEIKKFKGFNKHLGYFLNLSTLIFIFAGIVHVCILIKGIEISIGNMVLPTSVSYLAIFISLCMTIMAVYYMKALKKEK